MREQAIANLAARLSKGPSMLVQFDPERNAAFCTEALETYAFARREAVVIDAITLVAAIEYVDRISRRSARIWARDLSVEVPVYDLARWQNSDVTLSLHEALTFLTGDFWSVTFVKRFGIPPPKPQDTLPLPSETKSVIAYSDGLDSRAVSSLISLSCPDSLLRVRVASKASAGASSGGKPVPFTGIPYEVVTKGMRVDSTARSRGFKFAVFAGIAAYLANAEEVVVPESGQGVFGPVLIPVMHAYRDYRNHPLFTARIEVFLKALLDYSVYFRFPRLWNTKAETLKEYVSTLGVTDWMNTRSCWQDSRWCSFNGKRRQCGVCAACMLRRMSVHAADLTEPDTAFICENLKASSLENSVVPGFERCGTAFRNYAIAGVLQLDHFSDQASNSSKIAEHSHLIAQALTIPPSEAEEKLADLIRRHAREWRSFVEEQGRDSFLRSWTRGWK